MSLLRNNPNPFSAGAGTAFGGNPETKIRYQIPDAGYVTLVIYNSMGQVVRILVDGHQNPGSYEAVWDGKGENGKSLVSGMYLCRIRSGPFSSMVKPVMMKQYLIIIL
jgi:flagellar hook assembly protein FlgD